MLAYERLIRDWQACICSIFFNYDLDRVYCSESSSVSNPNSPGFTEVWGISSTDPTNNITPPHSLAKTDWTDAVMIPSYFENDERLFVLWQHRPAWAEQLLLRVTGLSHRVENVSYGVLEATGPLPCLMDSQQPTTTTTTTTLSPVLVSRRPFLSKHRNAKNENAILQYIVANLSSSNANNKIESEPDTVEFHLIRRLVQSTLKDSFTVLCYQDTTAWFGVHRAQSLASYRSQHHFFPWLVAGWFQTFCERNFALLTLPRGGITIPQALEQAKDAYQLLERHLEQQQQPQPTSDETCYLFRTANLTVTDALLFDHLMHAVNNVYLVTVLPQYPSLCKYFESIAHVFFQNSHHNYELNNARNAENAFVNTHLFLLLAQKQHKKKVDADQKLFDSALNLMTTPSSSLSLAHILRHQTSSSLPQHLQWTASVMAINNTPRKTLPPTETHSSTTPAEVSALDSHRRGDELWLASIMLATLVAFGHAARLSMLSSSSSSSSS